MTLAPTHRPDAWTTFEEEHSSEACAIDRAFIAYRADGIANDLDEAKTDVDRLAKFIAWQALLKGWRAVEMGKWMRNRH